MIKKRLLLVILALNLIFIGPIFAKTKECLVKPSYDIIIHNDLVMINNPKNSLTIKLDGAMTLNNFVVSTKPTIQQEAKQFQTYLRQQLPTFEKQAHNELDNVRATFEKAIRDRLGNDSKLLKSLNNLYTQLIDLLSHAIITKNNITYFYYQPFNNLKKDGEAIGKKVFYKIIGDSILSFNVFKNYSAIKKIAKQEWKEQKTILKSFDDDICVLITDIDDRYNHLMKGVSF